MRELPALVRCDVLARRAAEGRRLIADEELRVEMRTLVERHGASWNRSADDPVEVEALLAEALAVLADLDLVERVGGGVRPLPLCGRFRDPRIKRPPEED